MDTLIWMMVGILLLTITIFVHRHTYTFYCSKRISLQVWKLLLGLGIALIPTLNLVAFLIGAIFYFICIINSDIVFRYDAKWWKSLKRFLCKEV